MILLCAPRTDPGVAALARALHGRGAHYRVLGPRALARSALAFTVDAGAPRGHLLLDELETDLACVTGVYLPCTDEPPLDALPTAAARRRAQAAHAALLAWCEVAPGHVLNRPSALGAGASGPYLAQLVAAAGFEVPDTLVTTDAAALAHFRASHAAVDRTAPAGEGGLVRLRARGGGVSIRVHVVGSRSDAPDAALGARCVALAHALGLELAAVDLRLGPGGSVTVLDVDPCPALGDARSNDLAWVVPGVAALLAGAQADVSAGETPSRAPADPA